MKKMVLLSLFISLFAVSCTMNSSSFWEIIKLDIEEKQHVEDIVQLGKDTIFITGWYIPDDQKDIGSYIPYILMSFDGGAAWREKTDFDCNELEEIKYYDDSILIVRASKYIGDPKLHLGSKNVWFKYYIKDNRWELLDLPEGTGGGFIQVISKRIFVSGLKKNGQWVDHAYTITRDGGKNWAEYSLPFDNKRDIFNEYCVQGNKLWGVRRHEALVHDKNEKEYQMVISINIDTWEIIDEIPLGTFKVDEKNHRVSTHNVTKIIAEGEMLYFLGQDDFTNTGYVWKMDVNDKEIKVQNSFKLTKAQEPVDLFYHEGKLIVAYMDMSSFLPSYILLHKKLNEESWNREIFPDLTYSYMSFSDGVLMGITEGNKVYYKEF